MAKSFFNVSKIGPKIEVIHDNGHTKLKLRSGLYGTGAGLTYF